MNTCGICGTAAPGKFRIPRPVQPPDLDGRPGEPARSTLHRWVATCRHCGAAAPDLAALPASAAALLHSADYKSLRDPHLRWAFLAGALGNRREAAEATLEAAWTQEDAGEPSDMLRRKAAELFGTEADTSTSLRRIDILRRAGAFAEAADLARRQTRLDESGTAILAFETDRIAARDSSRHQISAAIRPPSHRPHVSQTSPRRRGLLGRLFSSGK